MKKIIVVLMFLLSITIFAEKLTTDGKYHFDKIMGYWGYPGCDISKKGDKIYMSYDLLLDKKGNDRSGELILIKAYKKGVFKVEFEDNIRYFAYDIKLKKLVEVDSNMNIITYGLRTVSENVN